MPGPTETQQLPERQAMVLPLRITRRPPVTQPNLRDRLDEAWEQAGLITQQAVSYGAPHEVVAGLARLSDLIEGMADIDWCGCNA